MSSPESGADSNPFAAPAEIATPSTKATLSMRVSTAVAWLLVSSIVQAALTAFTVRFIRQQILGPWIETPYLHLVLTVGFVLCTTIVLSRRYTVRSTSVVAQVMNALQWIVFASMISLLRFIGFSDVSMSSEDVTIFVGIWLASAIAISVLCWLRNRQIRNQAAADDVSTNNAGEKK